MDFHNTSLFLILVFCKICRTLALGFTPTSCMGVACPQLQRCVMKQVQCIRAPCNPVPVCVSIVPKLGRCPRILDAGVCMRQCVLDSECIGSLKCCNNGCGNICVLPVNDISLPRQCPNYRTIDSKLCNMHHRCDGDQQCGSNQRCCKRGCQRQCIDVVKLPVIMERPVGGNGRCSQSQMYLYCMSEFFSHKCCSECGLRCNSVDTEQPDDGHCPTTAPAYNHNAPECIQHITCPSGQKCCPCRVSFRSWGHGSGFKNQCIHDSNGFAGSYRRQNKHNDFGHGYGGNDHGNNYHGGNGDGGSSSSSSSSSSGGHGGGDDNGYADYDHGGGGDSSSSSDDK